MLVIVFVNSLLINLIANFVTGDSDYYSRHLILLGLSLLLSALMVRQLDELFKERKEQQRGTYVIDKKTLSGKEHTFFFIPFRKWPGILACIGTGLILYGLFVSKS